MSEKFKLTRHGRPGDISYSVRMNLLKPHDETVLHRAFWPVLNAARAHKEDIVFRYGHKGSADPVQTIHGNNPISPSIVMQISQDLAFSIQARLDKMDMACKGRWKLHSHYHGKEGVRFYCLSNPELGQSTDWDYDSVSKDFETVGQLIHEAAAEMVTEKFDISNPLSLKQLTTFLDLQTTDASNMHWVLKDETVPVLAIDPRHRNDFHLMVEDGMKDVCLIRLQSLHDANVAVQQKLKSIYDAASPENQDLIGRVHDGLELGRRVVIEISQRRIPGWGQQFNAKANKFMQPNPVAKKVHQPKKGQLNLI